MDGAQRATQSDGLGHDLLDLGLSHRRPGSTAGIPVARLFRVRIHWRHWAGNRIHLARIHAHALVSGPTRARHRIGDHGLWWRRANRVAVVERAAGALW